eukprot:2173106-Alexandrium_andersonii.AAC.1
MKSWPTARAKSGRREQGSVCAHPLPAIKSSTSLGSPRHPCPSEAGQPAPRVCAARGGRVGDAAQAGQRGREGLGSWELIVRPKRHRALRTEAEISERSYRIEQKACR